MNTNESEFLALTKQYEKLKSELEQVRESLNASLTKLGTNTFVQDPETLVVYKIIKPTGTFVYYKELDYVRTSLEGERAGTLSKKQAEEAGFTLKR